MPEKKVLQFNISIQEHDAKFRPSNCSLNSEFSYPEYIACPVTPKSAVPMESSKK